MSFQRELLPAVTVSGLSLGFGGCSFQLTAAAAAAAGNHVVEPFQRLAVRDIVLQRKSAAASAAGRQSQAEEKTVMVRAQIEENECRLVGARRDECLSRHCRRRYVCKHMSRQDTNTRIHDGKADTGGVR